MSNIRHSQKKLIVYKYLWGEWGNNGHGGIPATSKSPTYLFFYGAVLRPVFSVIDMHIHDAVTLA